MGSLKAHEAQVAELRRSIAELEARLSEQRERLVEAEAALESERNRPPAIGEFARSTLTHFYGRITKVTPRPDGRAWVEINPYLTPTLPGRSTLDLFDAWELIDDPAASQGPGEATGIEIVTQLTETLAMFRSPSESQAFPARPFGSQQALPAPQATPTPTLPSVQAFPPAQGFSSPQPDESSGAEAAHGRS
jgi:hypothetical protein